MRVQVDVSGALRLGEFEALFVFLGELFMGDPALLKRPADALTKVADAAAAGDSRRSVPRSNRRVIRLSAGEYAINELLLHRLDLLGRFTIPPVTVVPISSEVATHKKAKTAGKRAQWGGPSRHPQPNLGSLPSGLRVRAPPLLRHKGRVFPTRSNQLSI